MRRAVAVPASGAAAAALWPMHPMPCEVPSAVDADPGHMAAAEASVSSEVMTTSLGSAWSLVRETGLPLVGLELLITSLITLVSLLSL